MENLKNLKSQYIVLTSDIEDFEIKISKRANFEEKNLCETYDNYGQSVGCYNAGCYSLSNSQSEAIGDMLKSLYEHFRIEYEKEHLDDNHYEMIEYNDNKLLIGVNQKEIQVFIETWKKENENHTPCTSYDYWDGSNHKSVVIEHIGDQTDMSEASESLSDEILEEFFKAECDENYETEESGTGYKTCKVNKYKFVYSAWQGAWEIASVFENEE